MLRLEQTRKSVCVDGFVTLGETHNELGSDSANDARDVARRVLSEQVRRAG